MARGGRDQIGSLGVVVRTSRSIQLVDQNHLRSVHELMYECTAYSL